MPATCALNFDRIALAVILTSHAVVQVAISLGPIRGVVGIPRYDDPGSIAVETGLVYWANGPEGFIARMHLDNGVIEQLYVGSELCGVAVDSDALFWADCQ